MDKRAWSVRGGRFGNAPVSLTVPGDKSITHRALMLTGIADGRSEIHGFLDAADTRATLRIMQALGVRIEEAEGVLRIDGVGLHGLRAPHAMLECGNAGTAMRLLAGLLSGQAFNSALTGDASLNARPMGRIVDPLARMGARIQPESDGTAPLRIEGTVLRGITYEPGMASAQVKSAVLLAGLYAAGETRVTERKPTRPYTEQLLAAMGYPIVYGAGHAALFGGHPLNALRVDVPGDFSSAAFPLVATLMADHAKVILRNVGIDATRTGLMRALRLMGAQIQITDERREIFGAVADIEVVSGPLRGMTLPEDWVADMIDEIPVLCAAAAVANGVTVIRNASELRVKESDRIKTMVANLRAMNVDVEEFDDGLRITGNPSLSAATLQSFDDHRIAMSCAVLATRAHGESRIEGVANVDTSFPGFAMMMRSAGYAVEEITA